MTDLEQTLLRLLEEERNKSHELTLLLLERTETLHGDQTVIVPDSPQGVGRVPWSQRKAMLEKKFRRFNDASEIGEAVRSDGSNDARGDHGSPEESGVGVYGEDSGKET